MSRHSIRIMMHHQDGLKTLHFRQDPSGLMNGSGDMFTDHKGFNAV
jgi:hypothetical protein